MCNSGLIKIFVPSISQQTIAICTVDVTETCRFWNRRTAIILLKHYLVNVIRTVTWYINNTRSTGVAFDKNGRTVLIITMRAVSMCAMYLIVLACEFDAV